MIEPEILDSSIDRQRWNEVLDSFPRTLRDIYFAPDYLGLHVPPQKGRALLFVFRKDHRQWLYPFLIEPIHNFGAGGGFFDINAPYGYGGPLSNTDDEHFLADAHSAFTAWCQSQSVVAEFVRLHPLIDNQRWLDPQATVLCDRETVSLDLSRFEVCQLPYDTATCYMLRRASRLDCNISVRQAEDTFEQFVGLYLETMASLGAEDYYYFDPAYFGGLQKLVQRTGWLVVAEAADGWVAASLFLRGANWLHYHLAAARPDRRLPGIANLLIHTAAQVGHESGLSLLHLGGGRTASPQDNLLKFKATMAPNRHQFRIAKRVHRPAVHLELCDAWRQAHPELVPLYGQRVLCYHHVPRVNADWVPGGLGL